MIQFNFQLLDINQYELDKVRPAEIIERREKDCWVVREQPFDTAVSPRYSYAREGNFLRVPLFPYLAQNDFALAIGLGLKLGTLNVIEWQADRPDMARRYEAVYAHVVMGHPVQQWPDNIRFWCGVAMLLKERRRD